MALAVTTDPALCSSVSLMRRASALYPVLDMMAATAGPGKVWGGGAEGCRGKKREGR
jgi:hypothetical protein